MRDKVQFSTNVPQVLAIDPRFPELERVEGRYGDQVRANLTENRIAYFEPEVAEQIKALRIRPGEAFSICKQEVRDGNRRSLKWAVDFSVPGGPRETGTGPAANPQGNGTQAHGSNGGERTARGHATHNGIPYWDPKTELRRAYEDAIEVLVEARDKAAAKGLPVQFVGEDLRAVAATLYINKREGGAAWQHS